MAMSIEMMKELSKKNFSRFCAETNPTLKSAYRVIYLDLEAEIDKMSRARCEKHGELIVVGDRHGSHEECSECGERYEMDEPANSGMEDYLGIEDR